MKNLYSDDAFTGLEAAIVLIAFVVVAAVFSYVVLGAGFFTSQTAQATVHTGVQQASSSMELVGNVYGLAPASGAANLTSMNVTVALTAGGTGMDLSQMVVSYRDNNGGYNSSVQFSESCGDAVNGGGAQLSWCIGEKLYSQNGVENNVLDPNEQMILIVGMPITATPNTKISVNFQPAIGAVLPVTRTVPGSITKVQAVY
ncbi:MAG: flagellin [Methanomicrobiales archaeon HGW-Methanomicrobiales-1]|nr:MAG: flagellin [Methanomicrobiales archaeon HGW-Methanomicrobiales-1]